MSLGERYYISMEIRKDKIEKDVMILDIQQY